MPRSKQTAHAELDGLRQGAAAERVKQRTLAAEAEAASLAVERASAAIAHGYAAEDERAVAAGRKAEEAAVANLKDIQHRLNGAELRVQRAQRALDDFQRDRARDLLAEREQAARAVTAELATSARETVRAPTLPSGRPSTSWLPWCPAPPHAQTGRPPRTRGSASSKSSSGPSPRPPSCPRRCRAGKGWETAKPRTTPPAASSSSARRS